MTQITAPYLLNHGTIPRVRDISPMKRILALLLSIAIPATLLAADAQSGYKVTYDGGSLLDTKSGAGLKLQISQTTITFVRDKAEVVTIPTSAVTEIS